MAFGNVLRRRLVSLFAMSLVMCVSSVVVAQTSSGAIDLEPPLIEHEVVNDDDAGDSQSFMATVVDDVELSSVTLFHRRAGEPTYNRVLMKPLSTSASWVARISTEPEDARDIEYYIEARDKSGNRTLRGYIFSPLVRRLTAPATVAEEGPPVETAPSADSQTVPGMPAKVRSKKLYYVLGAVGVAVLAGLALSGGDSDDERGCSEDGCELTFTVEQPN